MFFFSHSLAAHVLGFPCTELGCNFFEVRPCLAENCINLVRLQSFKLPTVFRTVLVCNATGRRSRPRRPWNRQKQAVFLGGAARPQYSSAFVVRPPVLARTRIRGDGTPTAATGSWNRSPAPALLFGRMPEEKNVSLIRQLLWIR
jgi:hypothetical protein